ncbi:glycosyltransferase family 4 protein [Spirochaetota bacterium]
MKVLLLGYSGNPFCGGLGIYIYNLSRELSKLGVDVDLLVGPPYPEPVDEWAKVHKVEYLATWAVKTKDIEHDKLTKMFSPWNLTDYILSRLHIFPQMETFSMQAFFRLKKFLKNKKYDIIHDVQSLGWGLLPMKGYGIPIITTVHHPLTRDRDEDLKLDKNFWEKVATLLFYPINMQRFVIKRLDRVITSFKEGIDELNNAFGLKKNRISVVYNGMDVELFKNTGEKREENNLLFVGNSGDNKKGITYLLEAIKMLPGKIKLTIVDEKRDDVMKSIKEMGLTKRITITGRVNNKTLVSLYSRKTILVMSSLYEGFGLPAAEAMSCETPVVATTAGALKEVVNSETGILVRPRDSLALKNAILKLIDNKKLRTTMGQKGRKRAVENFAWPIAAKNTLNVYKDVIKNYRN